MKKSILLLIDGLINLALGILLILYTEDLGQALGIPIIEQYFYPRILGAILFGIAIALFMEYFKKTNGLPGLGLGGAIAINLCGGLVLILFLLFGDLSLPVRGQIILWGLVFLLIGISSAEIIFYRFKKRKNKKLKS